VILHADRQLATRIETISASETRRFAETTQALYPEIGAAWVDVADGVAGFCGPDSAVNGTARLGMTGVVVESDVVEVERFFRDRGARPIIGACPLADDSLARWLTAREWVIAGFENVLARELRTADEIPAPDPAIEIRLAETAEERLAWAALVTEGFSAPEQPTVAETRLGLTAVAMTGRSFLSAFIDGEPAGTGELLIADGIGLLSADTTMPRFRGRGVQQSLQRARLWLARDAGCELAVSESMPGSGSQRNMERIGFRVVYTRVDAAAPLLQESL